jgi:hypothetical protein
MDLLAQVEGSVATMLRVAEAWAAERGASRRCHPPL